MRLLLTMLLFFIAIAAWDSAAMYSGFASNKDSPRRALDEVYEYRSVLVALTAIAGLIVVQTVQTLWRGAKRQGAKIPQYRLRTLLIIPILVAAWGGLWASAARPSITILVFIAASLLLLFDRRRAREP